LDCINPTGNKRSIEAVTSRDGLKSVYNIDIDNIDNMIQKIFAEKKKNIS
jgi:hypothetical protein